MRQLLSFFLILSISVTSVFSQQHDYGEAVYLSTYYLGAQRCGDTKSWIHGACHTQDGKSVNASLDVSGGWHDCGDNIKFNLTTNWSAVMYLMGYRHFSAGFVDQYSPDFSQGPSNGIPDILDETKIQTDYLIKCLVSGTFYYQVGNGPDDHDGSFAEPVTQSAQAANKGGDPRAVYSTTVCPNITGNAAAALALMSMEYRPYDATYADLCLTKAIEYYTLAKSAAPGSCGSIACDSGGNPCYDLSSKSSDDEVALAAVLLYEATGITSYLTDAKAKHDDGLWAGEEHYYGSVYMLTAAELYNATNTISYLNQLTAHFNYHNNATFIKCGGVYIYQWSGGWGNFQYTGNESFIAALVHKFDNNNTAAYNFAKNNVDYILGEHGAIGNIPANFSFLIGYDKMGGTYPKAPHHKPAFGSTKTNWSNFNAEVNNPGSIPYAHELTGALVGGVNNDCNHFDVIDDFQTNEVCTYYNAGFTGAVAYVNKIENSIVTGVNSPGFKTTFSVYPNPSLNVISILDREIETFDIYNSSGILLKSGVTGSNSIDISSFEAGVYLVKKRSTSEVLKFMKN